MLGLGTVFNRVSTASVIRVRERFATIIGQMVNSASIIGIGIFLRVVTGGNRFGK
jgi:hypothetical protein